MKHCLWIVGLIALSTTSATAYEKDTHYVLTYCLARLVGFTTVQAQAIASADVSIDLDPNTEPFQIDKVVTPWELAQPIRVRFHAFPDSGEKSYPFIVTPADQKLAGQNKAARLGDLWQQALNIGNPGIYLHYQQDVFAHKGYWSRAGHTSAGNRADFLASDRVAAQQMADTTLYSLRAFMLKQHKQLNIQPNYVETSDFESLVSELAKVNPPPRAVANYDPGILKLGDPNITAAFSVGAAFLHENVPSWNVYHFSKDLVPIDKMEVQPAGLAEYLPGAWKLAEAGRSGRNHPLIKPPDPYVKGTLFESRGAGATASHEVEPVLPPISSLLHISYDGATFGLTLDAKEIGSSEWKMTRLDEARRTLVFEKTPRAEELPQYLPKELREAGKVKWTTSVSFVSANTLCFDFECGPLIWEEGSVHKSLDPTHRLTTYLWAGRI